MKNVSFVSGTTEFGLHYAILTVFSVSAAVFINTHHEHIRIAGRSDAGFQLHFSRGARLAVVSSVLLGRWYTRIIREYQYYAGVFTLWRTIRANAENGVVAIWSSGRDCDGYRWNNVSMVPATLRDVTAWANNFEKWLDGPGGYVICAPSTAPNFND